MLVKWLQMQAQSSLRIGTVSPGPTIYAYTSSKNVIKVRPKRKTSYNTWLRMQVCVIVTSKILRRACTLAQTRQSQPFIHISSVKVHVSQTKTIPSFIAYSCIVHGV